ncbi:MAG: sigma-70 family RNA polymerase sigma factor [Longimonas sp.]|uniref:RNA polymerase sigma factor n=1 Tax=Longimonas sp. TaxID=2039626 RepID=UPI00334A2C22
MPASAMSDSPPVNASDGPNGPRSDAAGTDADTAAIDALCERLRASDRDAFKTVFCQLSPRIFRFVRGMVASDEKARDITQETFTKLWSIRTELDDVDSLTAYVFQMARNRVYNLQRDEQTRRTHETAVPSDALGGAPPAPDAELDADLLRTLLDRWIDELPARQREALTLRRIDGMTHEAIADIMEISPNTVNNHIVRALDHLRARLREHRPDLLP